MAVTVQWYGQGLSHYLAGNIDFDGSAQNCGLLINTYTPDLDADEFWKGGTGVADGSREVVGTGYTADGQVLASKTITDFASSALSAWAATTGYALGDMARKVADDGFGKICVVAGTSNDTEPTWVTTAFRETLDNNGAGAGDVVWGNLGPSVAAIDFANPSWTTSTITARYGVLFNDGATPGTDDYVWGLIDFGQDESSSAGTFEIQLPSSTPAGVLFLGSGAAV